MINGINIMFFIKLSYIGIIFLFTFRTAIEAHIATLLPSAPPPQLVNIPKTTGVSSLITGDSSPLITAGSYPPMASSPPSLIAGINIDAGSIQEIPPNQHKKQQQAEKEIIEEYEKRKNIVQKPDITNQNVVAIVNTPATTDVTALEEPTTPFSELSDRMNEVINTIKKEEVNIYHTNHEGFSPTSKLTPKYNSTERKKTESLDETRTAEYDDEYIEKKTQHIPSELRNTTDDFDEFPSQ
jgi:hypothetical protein